MARITKVIPPLLITVIGGLFLYAGVLKAIQPAEFATDIDHYHLLPWRAAAFFSLYLPWLEIISGGSLFFAKTRRAALWLLLSMTSVFLMALLSAWARGLDIRCGCFGSADAGSPIPIAVLRDLAILGAIVYLLWRDRGTEVAARPRYEPAEACLTE